MEAKMTYKIWNFLKREDGASAIEYGLIAALISIVLVVVLGTVGDELSLTFDTIATTLSGG